MMNFASILKNKNNVYFRVISIINFVGFSISRITLKKSLSN